MKTYPQQVTYFERLHQCHRGIPHLQDQVKLQLLTSEDRYCIRRKERMQNCIHPNIISHFWSSRDNTRIQTCPCLACHLNKGQDKQPKSLAKDQGADSFFFFFFEVFKCQDIIKLPEGFSKAIRNPSSENLLVLLKIPYGIKLTASFDI